MRPNSIVGRSRELDQIQAFLEGVAAGPSALLITGEAGIGKTALLDAAVELASEQAGRTISIRAHEEESLEPWLSLHDLFDSVGIDPPSGEDPSDIHRQVLATVRRVSDAGPLLIAVDDANWMDQPSARAIRFSLRRLKDEPVAIVATSRSGSDAETRLGLRRSHPTERVTEIEVQPLGRDDIRELIDPIVERIQPSNLTRIVEASGGNPLYATELARAIAVGGRSYEVGEAIPLPPSLHGVFEARLDQVPSDMAATFQVLALTGPVVPSRLEATLPDLDLDRILPNAADQGLLTVLPDQRVAFTHPLLSTAVASRIDPFTKRQIHRRCAEVETDPTTRLWHLALSTDEPDEEIAIGLETAAANACDRGATDTASFYSRHSIRLTNPGDENALHRRRLQETTHLAASGRVGKARELLDGLIEQTPPGPKRAELLVQRFYVENDDVATGDAILTQALAEAGSEPAMKGRVLDILGWHRGVFRGDLSAGLECAGEATHIAAETEDTALWTVAAAHLAHMRSMSGTPDFDLAYQADASARTHGAPTLGGGPRAWLAKQRFWSGEVAEARQEFTVLLESGQEIERPYRFYDLSLVACVVGDLADAVEFAEKGILSAQDSDNADAEGWLQYPLALAQAWMGDTGAARETASALLTWPGRPHTTLGQARAHHALGVIALSSDDRAGAVEELSIACRLADEVGLANPGALPVLPNLVIALALAGENERAHSELERLAIQARRLDNSRTSALYRHAEGVLALADGDTSRAIDALEWAVAENTRLGLKPARSRGLLQLGRSFARSGQPNTARTHFDAALEEFESMGAMSWVAVAKSSIARLDANSGLDQLTSTETRIAELVATGLKNREIASELFVSPATVEAHLTRIYRKLAIRSRSDLARRVTEWEIAGSTQK